MGTTGRDDDTGFGSDVEITDEDLLGRHLTGDPDAFGVIVRRHRDRLWAVALRTLGDREEAADALQDAFVSALRGAANFRGEAKVTTWLHRIVVNACLDRVRRRQARPTVPLPPDDLAPAAPDALGASERAAEVQAALAQLPVEQASALVLVDALGYAVEDAARILDAPTGTVKSRCSRGRARLALALGHLRDGADEGRDESDVSPRGNQGGPGAVGVSTDPDPDSDRREEADPR